MAFLEQLTRFWSSLTSGQKITAIGSFLAVVGSLYFLSFNLRGEDLTPLYGRLAPEDAAQVVERLRNEGVRHKLTNGGQTVLVPSRQVFDLRLRMSQAGLPRGEGRGLELFEKTDMGMSDFAQQVNYQRALQGELARTIGGLEDVEEARVHIVFPESSPFIDNAEGASASVVLRLKPGASLHKSQVYSIIHLVAGAVKGLKAERVSVLDTAGTLLAGGREADGIYSLGNEYLELQQDVEKYLEQKALTLLDGLLGSGKAIVRVRADMDSQVIKEQSERYEPTGPVRSEQTLAQGGGARPQSSVKNYEVGRTVKEVIASPGVIRRLNISLAINGVTKEDPNNPGQKIYQPRTAEELDSIAILVKQAVGFSEDREDKLEIKNIAFDQTQKEAQLAENKINDDQIRKDTQRRQLFKIGGQVGTALGMALALMVFLKFMKSLPTPGAGISTVAISDTTPASPAAPISLSVQEPATPNGSGAENGAPKPAGNNNAQIDLAKAAKRNPAELAKAMQRQYMPTGT